jgi:hypothetical protein
VWEFDELRGPRALVTGRGCPENGGRSDTGRSQRIAAKVGDPDRDVIQKTSECGIPTSVSPRVRAAVSAPASHSLGRRRSLRKARSRASDVRPISPKTFAHARLRHLP